jgi:hypothetical protein
MLDKWYNNRQFKSAAASIYLTRAREARPVDR